MDANTGMSATAMNPLLQQAEVKVEAAVKPEMKNAYNRIVAAGMKAAYDKTSHASMMQSLANSKDPIHDVAVGAVGLMMILYKESHNTMPPAAMPQAGMTLLLNGLDYLEKIGKIKVDAGMIDQATKIFLGTIMPKLGLTPDVMAKANQRVNAAKNDPAIMSKINSQVGGQNGV